MSDDTNELLQGAMDLLVLRAISTEKRHGWGILKRIQQCSQDALVIHQGSLYPALYRLERQSFIKSEFGLSENNRKAKYYSLTRKGKRKLETEIDKWKRFVDAIQMVLKTA